MHQPHLAEVWVFQTVHLDLYVKAQKQPMWLLWNTWNQRTKPLLFHPFCYKMLRAYAGFLSKGELCCKQIRGWEIIPVVLIRESMDKGIPGIFVKSKLICYGAASHFEWHRVYDSKLKSTTHWEFHYYYFSFEMWIFFWNDDYWKE